MGRTFASLKNYQVDGNKEMMAIGFMNMAGSCTSCYVTTGDDPFFIPPSDFQVDTVFRFSKHVVFRLLFQVHFLDLL